MVLSKGTTLVYPRGNLESMLGGLTPMSQGDTDLRKAAHATACVSVAFRAYCT